MQIIKIILAVIIAKGVIMLGCFVLLLKFLERKFKFKVPFKEGLLLAKKLLTKLMKK